MSNFLQGVPKECVGLQGLGVHYVEFSCLYPTLGKLYLPFEKFYDPAVALVWMQEHPFVPIVACILYVAFIIAGRAYMSSRPPLSWRKTLAVWNFALSLFSWIGAFRVAPSYTTTYRPTPFGATYATTPRLCTVPDPRACGYSFSY